MAVKKITFWVKCLCEISSVASPTISPAMQISNYNRHSFLWKSIVFTVSEHESFA